MCAALVRRVVNAFLGGVGNCYLNLGILGRELSVSAVKSACRNLFVRHGYDFSMAAVVGDRQLAAREVKSLVVFIVCPGLLADCNGVDIIGAAIYLLLKLDWSVQEFNVIRFDISLQLDCLRLVRIGVKAQNLVVNHLCNYVPAAVRAVDPNPAEKRGIVCNGAVHESAVNLRCCEVWIANGIV